VALRALLDAFRVMRNTSSCLRRIADVQAAASPAVTQQIAVSAEVSGVRGKSYFVSNSDKQSFKERG